MDESYSNRNTFWLLLVLMLRVKPQLIEIADHSGLTIQQLHILSTLGTNGTQPMSFFAKALSCDASNITGIIDRLGSLGLVTRDECTKDRRIKNVKLTSEGQKLYESLMHEIALKAQEDMDAVLTETELATFRKTLIKILKAAQ